MFNFSGVCITEEKRKQPYVQIEKEQITEAKKNSREINKFSLNARNTVTNWKHLKEKSES